MKKLNGFFFSFFLKRKQENERPLSQRHISLASSSSRWPVQWHCLIQATDQASFTELPLHPSLPPASPLCTLFHLSSLPPFHFPSSLSLKHTHTPFPHSPFLQKPSWSSCTVPAVCWDDSSVSVGEVSVCSGCSAWAPVRPMAAPLGRHTARCCRGALLPWLCCRGTVAKSTSSSGSM